MLTKVKLWSKLIFWVPWMNDEWNELGLGVDELMDDEVVKYKLHEVKFQAKRQSIEAKGHN